jgi:Tol biopolymer transport system component
VALPFERIVRRCLAKRPEDRFQSAGDLAFALDALSSVAGRTTRAWSTGFPRGSRRLALALGGVALGGGLLIGGFVWRRSDHASIPVSAPVKVVPFASLPGLELSPAISPDGKQLAFAWDGGTGENVDVYVKLIDAGAPLRLTSHAGIDINPAWSPDGRYIAFVRSAGGGLGIFMVPALGGAERRLLSLGFTSDWFGWYPSLDWSPDGRFLAFPDRDPPEGVPAIFLLSIETLEKQRLTAPPSQTLCDWFPAFSPHGGQLAFSRWSSEGAADVYLTSAAGSEPKRLTFDDTWVLGLAWTADARQVVFESLREGSAGLWRVPVSGGTPQRFVAGPETGFRALWTYPPSLSRDGRRLAYVQSSDDTNVWRMEIPSSRGGRATPTKLIFSARFDGGGRFSPDGKRIVFTSGRSGTRKSGCVTATARIPRASRSSPPPTAVPRVGRPMGGRSPLTRARRDDRTST